MNTEPPKVEAVRFDQALYLIAQRSHGDQRDPKIREALETALAVGTIHSRLNRDGGYPPGLVNYSKGDDLPPEFWAPDNSERTELGNGVFGHVAIRLDGLMDWLHPKPATTSKGRKRGRRYLYDRDGFRAEVIRRKEQHGLQSGQTVRP